MYGPKREKFPPNGACSRGMLILHKNAGWSRQPSLAGSREDKTSDPKVDESAVRLRLSFAREEKCVALRNGFEKRHLLFVISGVRVVMF